MSTLNFDSHNLLTLLESVSAEALDNAQFGIVRMTPAGIVSAYNRCEAQLSGLSPATVIGRNFFLDVAPCTNNFMVAQKYEDVAELDETLDYVFTFRMRPTSVQLRLLRSAAAHYQYLIVRRKL